MENNTEHEMETREYKWKLLFRGLGLSQKNRE